MIDKENGFDVLTEEMYDKAMRKGQEAYNHNYGIDHPYAFHRGFETAMKELLSMRDSREGKGERVARHLKSFLNEIESLKNPELVMEWIHRLNECIKLREQEEKERHVQSQINKASHTPDAYSGHEKPPKGVKPRWEHLEERKQELLDACSRYSIAKKSVPSKWFRELLKISEELEEIHGRG